MSRLIPGPMAATVLLLCMMLAVSACGDATVRKRVQDIDYAIDAYAYALRWARIDDAIEYHMDRDGKRPEIDPSVMDDIRVTGLPSGKKPLPRTSRKPGSRVN